MAIQTLNTIKNWFRTNLKPTQAQFWDTWDSFRHKQEKVPVADIEGMDALLSSKASQAELDAHLIDENAHSIYIKKNERGFASIGGNGDLGFLHELVVISELSNLMINGGIGVAKGIFIAPEAKNYQGKIYSITNKQTNNVVLLHDNATATVPFCFSNEADYTIKINEVITFRFNGWGKFEMVSSSMPSAGVSSWNDLTDKPSTFAPSAHSHAIADVTGLATELGNKADLVGGKVPSTQLPSYVDDVIEVANFAALPVTGESGKIYITIDNNKTYRWGGSVYVELSSAQIPTVLGLIKIVDKAGDFFTNLATASAYIRNFTSATITNESYSNGTFWFTVPNGSSFANNNGFLYKLTPHTAYIEDYLELISFLGNNTLGFSSGISVLGNVRFGTNSLVSFAGILRVRNVTLVNTSDTFGVNASGRVEIYGTIGTTTGNDYANFFPNSTAVIWARKVMQTNNGGGIEGDLARAETNGAKLFFGYAAPNNLNVAFTDIVNLGSVTGAVSIDWALGVKHKLNLSGNVTITQTNYAAFEGQKVQEIQITSSSPAYTITWVDVNPADFTDTIDFTTGTTYNNVSVRLLRSNIFQSNNLVR